MKFEKEEKGCGKKLKRVNDHLKYVHRKASVTVIGMELNYCTRFYFVLMEKNIAMECEIKERGIDPLEEEAPETGEDTGLGNSNDGGGVGSSSLLGSWEVLGTILAVELEEEVHLDPEQLAECSNGLVLGITVQVERLDTSDQDLLDITQKGIDMDNIDVDLGLLGRGVGMDASDVLKVLDHALVVGVGQQSVKVLAQHVLAELDLLGILGQLSRILDHSVFWDETLMALGHDRPGDVELVELGVNGIDDDGDKGLNELGGTLDDIDVLIAKAHELGDILEAVDGVGVEGLALNVFHG